MLLLLAELARPRFAFLDVGAGAGAEAGLSLSSSASFLALPFPFPFPTGATTAVDLGFSSSPAASVFSLGFCVELSLPSEALSPVFSFGAASVALSPSAVGFLGASSVGVLGASSVGVLGVSSEAAAASLNEEKKAFFSTDLYIICSVLSIM